MSALRSKPRASSERSTRVAASRSASARLVASMERSLASVGIVVEADDRDHPVPFPPLTSLHFTVSVRAARPAGISAPAATVRSTSSSYSSSIRANRSGAMTASTASTELHVVHERNESSHVTKFGAGFGATSSLSTPHAAS